MMTDTDLTPAQQHAKDVGGMHAADFLVYAQERDLPLQALSLYVQGASAVAYPLAPDDLYRFELQGRCELIYRTLEKYGSAPADH